MKPAFKLQDLIQQGDSALVAASNMLGQQMAVINCTGVDFLTPSQIDLLLAEIPETWDFLALDEVVEPGSVSDLLAQQFSEWLNQRTNITVSDPESLPTVTSEGIDKILQFLPILEQKGSRLYEINPQQSLLEPCIYSNEVNGFIQTLHDEGFILLSFNWGVWLDEANEYVNAPELLEYVNLLTLQKLLTTYVRAERFNSGNLAQLIENGHVLAILKRLAAIRSDMEDVSLAAPPNTTTRITATRGDITEQQVDAIVNTTNIVLDVDKGVSASIHAVAGPSLKEECRKLKGCAVGQAKITRGYSLPAAWVIHTVAPVWQGGTQTEDALLAECYRNSLALAALCPIETIAFPSIGTGFRGFPPERAAHIAVAEVHQFLQHNTSLEKVTFVCRSVTVFDAYSKAIKELTEFFSSATANGNTASI